jgi:hypothetical protein
MQEVTHYDRNWNNPPKTSAVKVVGPAMLAAEKTTDSAQPICESKHATPPVRPCEAFRLLEKPQPSSSRLVLGYLRPLELPFLVCVTVGGTRDLRMRALVGVGVVI